MAARDVKVGWFSEGRITARGRHCWVVCHFTAKRAGWQFHPISFAAVKQSQRLKCQTRACGSFLLVAVSPLLVN